MQSPASVPHGATPRRVGACLFRILLGALALLAFVTSLAWPSSVSAGPFVRADELPGASGDERSGGPAAQATPSQAAAAGSATYSYTVERRGNVRSDVETFARIGRETLGDIRGWTLNHNVQYARVSSGGDFRLILASPEEVEQAHPICSSRWSCTVGDQVLINDRRWRNATPTWPRSRREYRSYVINHEVGHWLGLGHAGCPGQGRSAPVMMQQSKGLQGCRARVWPKYWERDEVAEIRGIGGWPTPPRDAPCTIRGDASGERLVGTWHADVICGRGGDDELVGGGGFDVLRAHNGDDVLRGGSRIDWLGGGQGADTLRGAAGRDDLLGRNGPDGLHGGGWDDELRGEAGDDLLLGKRGNDVLHGGGGADELHGNQHGDELHGNNQADLLGGGSGHDFVGGGQGGDLLAGASGRDRLLGRNGPDRLYGGTWDDVLRGVAGADRLRGQRGNDVLHGGGDADDLRGNQHGDELHGNRQADVLGGGVGQDFVAGGKSGDRIYGAGGRDRLLGRNGSDRLFGGPHGDNLAGHSGNDLLDGKGGFDTCNPGTGADVQRSCER